VRRRYEDVPPPELMVFEGHLYTTAAEWVAAFDEFCAARNRWLDERGLPVTALPEYKSTADQPWDPSWI
jgi:hypothetical protein